MEQLLLSVRSIAESWQCSEAHVRRLIKRKELPPVRLGRAVRVRVTDVEAYERAHTTRKRGT